MVAGEQQCTLPRVQRTGQTPISPFSRAMLIFRVEPQLLPVSFTKSLEHVFRRSCGLISPYSAQTQKKVCSKRPNRFRGKGLRNETCDCSACMFRSITSQARTGTNTPRCKYPRSSKGESKKGMYLQPNLTDDQLVLAVVEVIFRHLKVERSRTLTGTSRNVVV